VAWRGNGLHDVEVTYRRYFPLIREKCRRMLDDGAEADDVAQETFVRFWQSSKNGGDTRSATAFIYKTCTRLAIDLIREKKSRPRKDSELLALAATAPGADDALSVRRQLQELADQLPAGELEVALLSRLDRLTHGEIAAVLGVSDRTVRRGLARFDERVAALRKDILP
jgi:RNA polymerase sigma-70 factor (ECF subfamily)